MAAIGLVQGQPRALAFAPGVRSDLRLLQVDEFLLQEIIDKGVVVKGSEDDEAVLCTSDRTYAMKLVETTNLQLLVQPSDTECAAPGSSQVAASQGSQMPTGIGQGLMTQWEYFRSADSAPPILVAATSASHIELVEVAPRLGPLRQMLWERPYGLQDEGDEEDGDGDTAMRDAGGGGAGGSGRRAAGYTFEELLAAVQASPAELRSALEAEGAVQLGGRWRGVDPGYLGELLELTILTAQQEGMALGALREEALVDGLRADGYHPAIVRHCLKVYGKPVASEASGGAAASGGGGVWALDEAKVCVHFAHKVLGAGGRGSMLLSDFTAAWGRAVPHGVKPSLDMLKAEALVDGTGPEARISAFPASALPAEPADRFAALFRRRPRWEWTALEPYLAGVKVPGQSVEALLMRFARASQPTPDAPLAYSAR